MNLPSDGFNPYDSAPVGERLRFLNGLTGRQDAGFRQIIVSIIASASTDPDVMGAALSLPTKNGEAMRVGQLYPLLPLAYLILNAKL